MPFRYQHIQVRSILSAKLICPLLYQHNEISKPNSPDSKFVPASFTTEKELKLNEAPKGLCPPWSYYRITYPLSKVNSIRQESWIKVKIASCISVNEPKRELFSD
jgi:hypothetical protein